MESYDCVIEMKYDTIICGIPLKEMNTIPLPKELEEWFEKAKLEMGLPDVECRYISGEEVKKGCKSNELVHIGSMGISYLRNKEKMVFSLVQSDDGIAIDKKTMIHEMLHFVRGPHRITGIGDPEFYEEVDRIFDKITKKVS